MSSLTPHPATPPHPDHASGLIPAPSELRFRRGPAIAVVVLFLAVLAGSGLLDLVAPKEKPRLFGIEKGLDQRLREEATWRDGSRARLVEHDHRLTSRVRRSLGPYYTFALYHVFGEAQGEIVIGHDGWLFLEGRTRLPPNRDDGAVLADSAATLAAVERRLALGGTRLVVAPVPRKIALYTEFLPRGLDSRPALDAGYGAELEQRGVLAADLWTAFEASRDERPEELLYFQTDSHWTEKAQLLTAEAMARTGGFLVPEAARRSRIVSAEDVPQERDHLEYIGLAELPEKILAVLDLPDVRAFDVELRGDGPKRRLSSHENPRSMPRLAIAGTSFTARRKLPLFLEHFADQRVWNAAQAAVHPLDTVTDLLTETPRVAWPEILALELPGHNAYGRNPLPGADEFFVEVPPPASAPSLQLRRLARPKIVVAGPLEVDGHIGGIARLDPGRLVHDGGGVAELEVEGWVEPTDPGVGFKLAVTHGGKTRHWPWPSGRRRLVVPLLAGAATGDLVSLHFIGHGRAKLSSARIIAHLDPSTAVPGRLAPVRETGEATGGISDGGFRQAIAFPEEPAISPQGALVAELDIVGPFASPRLELVVYSRERPDRSLVLPLEPVSRRVVLAVDLGHLAGGHLVSAELRGQGVVPRQILKGIRYLEPGPEGDAFSELRKGDSQP